MSPLQNFQSFPEHSLTAQDRSETTVRLGKVGFDSDGVAVSGDRQVGFSLAGQDTAEVGVGLGVVRINVNGLSKLGDGLDRASPGSAENDADIVVGDGEVGLDAEGITKRGAMAGSRSPGQPRTLPRLTYAAARSGLIRMASRHSAMA